MLGSHLFLTKTCTRAIADELTAFFVVVLGVTVAVPDVLVVTPKGIRVACLGVVRVNAVIARITTTDVLLPDATLLTAITTVVTCTRTQAR